MNSRSLRLLSHNNNIFFSIEIFYKYVYRYNGSELLVGSISLHVPMVFVQL